MSVLFIIYDPGIGGAEKNTVKLVNYLVSTGLNVSILTLSDKNLLENISRPFPMKIVELKFNPTEKDKVSKLIGSLHLRPKRHSNYLAGLASLGLAQHI
jgi:hypothetical protein